MLSIFIKYKFEFLLITKWLEMHYLIHILLVHLYSEESLTIKHELSVGISNSLSSNDAKNSDLEFFESFISVPNDNSDEVKKKIKLDSNTKNNHPSLKPKSVLRRIEDTESEESEDDDEDEDEDYDPDEDNSDTKNNDCSLTMGSIQEELIS